MAENGGQREVPAPLGAILSRPVAVQVSVFPRGLTLFRPDQRHAKGLVPLAAVQHRKWSIILPVWEGPAGAAAVWLWLP